MGQKVNPHGLRVGVIKNWDSRWFAKDEVFGDTLVSDYKLRKYLKAKLQDAGVPKIEIERDANRIKVFIHCAKYVATEGDLYVTIKARFVTTATKSCCSAMTFYSSQLCQMFWTSSSSSMVSMSFSIRTACSAFRGW